MAPCSKSNILGIHGTMHSNYMYRGFMALCIVTIYTGDSWHRA